MTLLRRLRPLLLSTILVAGPLAMAQAQDPGFSSSEKPFATISRMLVQADAGCGNCAGGDVASQAFGAMLEQGERFPEPYRCNTFPKLSLICVSPVFLAQRSKLILPCCS